MRFDAPVDAQERDDPDVVGVVEMTEGGSLFNIPIESITHESAELGAGRCFAFPRRGMRLRIV